MLAALDDLSDELGHAATLSQIAERLGWSSKGSVHEYVERLRLHGVVDGRGRALRIARPPRGSRGRPHAKDSTSVLPGASAFGHDAVCHVTRGSAGSEGREAELFDDYSTRTLREALRLMNHALRLIAAPERWTREVWSRDSAGNEVDAASLAAVCWCAGGAILAANHDLYPARGALHIPIDPATGEAVMVRGPKRVVLALEALGIGFTHSSPERIQKSPAPAATPGRRQVPLAKQHPTLRASDINDLALIKHPHVVLALASTLAALHDEIERRAPAKPARRQRAGGGSL
ncbi:MAG TPA: hypothetical protein VH210_14930 [Gaiellaceae bacterium]|nr:hypothetical protein [Gaiellaceae bacterium]